jgi:multisubunit Na+/H+ antiporter MnhG subunit
VSLAEVVSWVLLVAGTLALVLAGVGASLPRDAFVRLHYVNLATMIGAPLVVLGMLVRDPTDWFKLLLVIVLLAGTSPAASAATARALTRTQGPERKSAP